jgi:hypothetical protein
VSKKTERIKVVCASINFEKKTALIKVRPFWIDSKDQNDFFNAKKIMNQASNQLERLNAAIEQTRKLITETQVLTNETREIALKGKRSRQKFQDSRNPKIAPLPETHLKSRHSVKKTNAA